MRPCRLARVAQRQPAPRDLDIIVRLGPTRELFEHPMLADDPGDGRVNVVVPAGGGLDYRHLVAGLQAHEVAMPEDVLEDLVIAPEPAALESRLRTSSVKLRALEEGVVFGCPQEVGRVHVGSQGRACVELDDPRVDRVTTKVARHRYPLLAVDHVVCSPTLYTSIGGSSSPSTICW